MKEKFYIGITFIILSSTFVTLFSYTTSPIYSEWGDTPDSPIFQIIGKYWKEGWIPYKDLWDLKGPYIFFMDAIGYWLTGTRIGVYLLQITFMVLTLMSIYKIFAEDFSRRNSMLMVIISLMSLSYIYEGGNLTEEYLLPFLGLSFFFVLKWVKRFTKEKVVEHPPLFATLYGVVLGLSLMSRLTNALPICGAVAVIAAVLLVNGRYKNLFYNTVSMMAGFVCSTLPFFIYFHHQSALYEMWNATFLYALKYAGNSTKDILSTGLHYFILSYLGSILLITVVFMLYLRQRSMTVRMWLYFMSAALPFVWFCQGNGFGHYGMTVFPLTAIALSEICKMKFRKVFVAVVFILAAAATSKIRYMWIMYNYHNTEITCYKEFLRQSPIADYSSFVAYNCSPNIYLALDIRPVTPFFALQDFAIERNPLLLDDVMKAFTTRQPQWILLSKKDDEQPQIHRILDTDYCVVKQDEKAHLILYKRIKQL